MKERGYRNGWIKKKVKFVGKYIKIMKKISKNNKNGFYGFNHNRKENFKRD